VEGLIALIKKVRLDLIQMRNLNIDPDLSSSPWEGEAEWEFLEMIRVLKMNFLPPVRLF